MLSRLQIQLKGTNGELAVTALDELSRVRGDTDALSMVRAELFSPPSGLRMCPSP